MPQESPIASSAESAIGGSAFPRRPVLCRVLLALAIVLVVLPGVLARLRDSRSSLPYLRHEDENLVIRPVFNILQTGSLHPTNFSYGSLTMYWATAWCAKGYSEMVKERRRTEFAIEGGSIVPSEPMLAAMRRGFLLLSLALLAGTAVLAVRWGPVAAVVAAASVSASQLLVLESSRILPNAPLALCTVGALAAAIRYMQKPTWTAGFLATFLAGAGMAFKVTAVFLILPIALAHLLSERRRSMPSLAALCIAPFAFFLAMQPFAILDFRHFLAEASWYFVYKYTERNVPDEPFAVLRLFVGDTIGEFGAIGALLAVAGAVAAMARRPRETAVCLAFLAPYLGAFLTKSLYFERQLAPVYPILAVFAGAFVQWAVDACAKLAAPRGRVAVVAVVVAAGLGVVLLPGRESVLPLLRRDGSVPRQDTRVLAVRHLRSVAEKSGSAEPVGVVFAAELKGSESWLASEFGDAPVRARVTDVASITPDFLRATNARYIVTSDRFAHASAPLAEFLSRRFDALPKEKEWPGRPVRVEPLADPDPQVVIRRVDDAGALQSLATRPAIPAESRVASPTNGWLFTEGAEFLPALQAVRVPSASIYNIGARSPEFAMKKGMAYRISFVYQPNFPGASFGPFSNLYPRFTESIRILGADGERILRSQERNSWSEVPIWSGWRTATWTVVAEQDVDAVRAQLLLYPTAQDFGMLVKSVSIDELQGAIATGSAP